MNRRTRNRTSGGVGGRRGATPPPPTRYTLVIRPDTLEADWAAVRRNGGAAGVDGQSIDQIAATPSRWAGARLVRYADDFAVMARYMGSRLQNWIEGKLEGG